MNPLTTDREYTTVVLSDNSEQPQVWSIEKDEVHVWHVLLEATYDQTRMMEAILSPAELERATSYRFEWDYRRYVVRRVALRMLLGRYLGAPPSQVQLIVGPYGKPGLGGSSTGSKLRFNSSHSFEQCLIAITCEKEVGIDIEWVQAELDIQEIAGIFFTRSEQKWIKGFPRNEQVNAFYQVWTHKEAYTKGKGMGLAIPLDSFEILPGSIDTSCPQNSQLAPRDTDQWTLCSLAAGSEYIASLAVEKMELPVCARGIAAIWPNCNFRTTGLTQEVADSVGGA